MRSPSLLTILLLLLPAAALAEQFEYGLRSQLGWTNNVFGTSEDAQTNSSGQLVDLDTVDDTSTRIQPWGKVSDPDGDLTWSLRYQPGYEYYLQESDLSGFDHDAKGELAWRVGERTTLFATEAFQQFRSLVRFNENQAVPTAPAVLQEGRDKILANLTTVGVRHFITPVDSVAATVTYNLRDFENANSSDRSTLSVGGFYRRSISPRTSLGASASWLQQTFERQLGGDAVTDYYNLSAVLEHRFSPTLSLELSGGPTLIDSGSELVNFSPQFGVSFSGATAEGVDATSCPLLNPDQAFDEKKNPHVTKFGFGDCGLPDPNRRLSPGELDTLGYPRGDPLVPGSTPKSPKLSEFENPFTVNRAGELEKLDAAGFGDAEVTYFASAALIKDWELWHAELVYQRDANESGSFGASSVQDALSLSVRWEPTPLWSLALTGAYTMIDQATDAAVPEQLVVANEAVPPGIDNFTQIATVQRVISKASDDALSYDTASVSLTASRRLTRTSSLFASLFWYQQEQNVDLNEDLSFLPTGSSDGNNVTRWQALTLWFGIDWHFDTIKF